MQRECVLNNHFHFQISVTFLEPITEQNNIIFIHKKTPPKQGLSITFWLE